MKGPLIHLLAAVILGLSGAIGCDRAAPPAPPAPEPATQPTTAPPPAPDPAPTTSVAGFLDLVRLRHPRFPSTQPLDQAVKYAEAAKIILDVPIYLDNRRDLWITHPDAGPLIDTLVAAVEEQVHVVPLRILYVRWQPDPAGAWVPTVVTPAPGGGYEAVRVERQGTGRRQRLVEHRTRLPDRDYLWHRAFDWRDGIAVPTATGASILWLSDDIRESHFDFVAEGLLSAAPTTIPATAPITAATAPTTGVAAAPAAGPSLEDRHIPQLVDDARGLLAFVPWDRDNPGTSRVARYIDNRWTTLAPETTDEKVVHLIPLLDGSLLRLVRGDAPGTVKLRLSLLETVELPEADILALVEQLSADLQDQRNAAFIALQQYGYGIWPLLERVANQQPPEARLRIRQLLKNRIAPTLGGMNVIADRLEIVSRQADRTVIMFAPQGVTIPGPQDQAITITPAWVATGPGTGIQLLPQRMIHELLPGTTHLQWVTGDWIASDTARGVRMWVGNEYLPLLGKEHAELRYVIGADRTMRWLFARRPITTGELRRGEEVLVLDRFLPDPTPRLPVWIWEDMNVAMGWDEKGYPGMKSGGAFVLDQAEWRNLDPETETFYTDPADVRLRASPATAPATQDAHGPPLAVAPDGTRYFGGRDELLAVSPAGREIRWPLPAGAVGNANPHAAVAPDGRLFLFNQRGRLLRIAPAPGAPTPGAPTRGAAEPFELEAIFTRNIPNVPEPLRLWVDPAGRLCFLASPTRMAICFPTGRVPRPIALLMPANAEEEW